VVVALIGNVGKYFGVKLDCGRRINIREQFKDHHNYSQGPWVGRGVKGKSRLGRGNEWDRRDRDGHAGGGWSVRGLSEALNLVKDKNKGPASFQFQY